MPLATLYAQMLQNFQHTVQNHGYMQNKTPTQILHTTTSLVSDMKPRASIFIPGGCSLHPVKNKGKRFC